MKASKLLLIVALISAFFAVSSTSNAAVTTTRTEILFDGHTKISFWGYGDCTKRQRVRLTLTGGGHSWSTTTRCRKDKKGYYFKASRKIWTSKKIQKAVKNDSTRQVTVTAIG